MNKNEWEKHVKEQNFSTMNFVMKDFYEMNNLEFIIWYRNFLTELIESEPKNPKKWDKRVEEIKKSFVFCSLNSIWESKKKRSL